MGPLRSSRAESVAATTATGMSSPTPQSSRLCGTPWRPSAILALAQPDPAQPALEAVHLPLVGLVVVAQAVEDAVQQQGLELALRGVTRIAGRGGLAASHGDADQDVPQVVVLQRGGLPGEGEDVGRLVLAAELAVDPPHLAVAAEAHAEALGLGSHRRQQADEPGAQPAGAGLRIGGGVLQDDVERVAHDHEAWRMAFFSRFGAALKSKPG